MFAILVEKYGAFRKRSDWYATEDEVLLGLANFLKDHKGQSFNVSLIESDEKETNGLGF